ncbi:MAG: hypothetical protein MZV64_13905 [Ignavibacteriales bacterium]|nr:hypothetical protein [Ignavibacteriales bacterium]
MHSHRRAAAVDALVAAAAAHHDRPAHAAGRRVLLVLDRVGHLGHRRPACGSRRGRDDAPA